MRLFQVLDELNQQDAKHGTKRVQISNSLVEAKTAKGGGHVTLGVPSDVLNQLVVDGDRFAVLLVVIERDAYEAAEADLKSVNG